MPLTLNSSPIPYKEVNLTPVSSTPNSPAGVMKAAFPMLVSQQAIPYNDNGFCGQKSLDNTVYSVPLWEIHAVSPLAWSRKGAYFTLPNAMFAFLS